MTNLKKQIFTVFALAVSITAILSIAVFSGLFSGINQKLTDSLYTYNKPSEDIIIVAIDDKTTMPAPFGFGRFSHWDRNNYAVALENLNKDNPKVIAFDLLFNNSTKIIKTEDLQKFTAELITLKNNKEKLEAYEKYIAENSDPARNQSDLHFAKTLKKSENTIIAMAAEGNNRVLPLPIFQKSAASVAHVNAHHDSDGILRRIAPYFTDITEKQVDSLAFAVAKAFLNPQTPPEPPLYDNKMLINYFADPFGYKMIPFIDVAKGEVPTGTFTDKIVLVGITSFKEVQDKVLTPRSNELPMPGVEVHANAIQTILDGKFLQPQSRTALLITIATLVLALTFGFTFLNITLSLILAVIALFGYFFAAHFFYEKGLILNIVYPFIAILLTFLASWVYRYFIADRKKHEITSAFGHYVSKDLVNEISKNPDLVKLGGEKRIVTVFFSDIENSTAYSEQIEIASWVAQINEYFTAMEAVIKKNGGTLDKYEGDAIMGFFNAPIYQPNHVQMALLTALQMESVLQKLHAKWQKESKPLIKFRIGINTGEALVGNFGSTDRFDYTVMGDTVNTASRLESSTNKTYGTRLICAGFENLIQPDERKQFLLRELDTVLLPGKKEPVKIYEILGISQNFTKTQQDILENYSQGLSLYRSSDYQAALTYFQKLPFDTPSQIIAARCQKLLNGEKIPNLDEQMIFKIAQK